MRVAVTRVAITGWILAALCLVASPAAAQTEGEVEPKSLFELLEMVERGLQVEKEENRRRVEAFAKAKDDQARLLAEAKATLAAEEATSNRLEETYNANELTLAQDQERLAERLGQLGELFGVVRQVANEASGNIWESLISAQLGQRKELLDRLGRSTELPSTDDLEQLWFELQREMTQQGEVVTFTAPVLTSGGEVEDWEVIRAGPFTAVARGKYLLWESTQGKLRELARQPPSRFVSIIADFESADTGFAALAVDPSMGSLLSALTETASFQERIGQGGYVGAVIISLGLLALLIGLVRWTIVTITSRRVATQRKSDDPDKNNPLGRVLSVYEENHEADPETLELMLDEVVLRESAQLERFQWVVKTVSVVAPLLGLLGTVTGMIQTFESITLFGTGDPKIMAGGISEALVTTMLGLITAIPLVLLSDTLSNSTRRILDVLDEQSAGLIATRAEDARA